VRQQPRQRRCHRQNRHRRHHLRSRPRPPPIFRSAVRAGQQPPGPVDPLALSARYRRTHPRATQEADGLNGLDGEVGMRGSIAVRSAFARPRTARRRFSGRVRPPASSIAAACNTSADLSGHRAVNAERGQRRHDLGHGVQRALPLPRPPRPDGPGHNGNYPRRTPSPCPAGVTRWHVAAPLTPRDSGNICSSREGEGESRA
jgi:hypothetical protein